MADRLNITGIVIASNNPGKVREINELLSTSTICVVPQSDFGVPEADETGLSFIENAILKARNAAEHTGRAAIADDSGIVVDALNGEPGILSARYAGSGASDEDNIWKLVNEVKSLPEDQRIAHFVCVMAYVRHASDPVPIIAEGIWDGIAMTEPKGKNGFGYDPMFYVPTHQCTSAELKPEVKNKISHRGQALRKLVQNLQTLRD